MWKRDRLEAALKARRQEPRDEFVARTAGSLEPRRTPVSRRSILAVSLAAAMVVSLASLGGLGEAVSGASAAAGVVSQAVSPDHVVTNHGKTSASSQYGHGPHGCVWRKKFKYFACDHKVAKWHCTSSKKHPSGHWHCVVKGKVHAVSTTA
jgi:hypothetical protein